HPRVNVGIPNGVLSEVDEVWGAGHGCGVAVGADHTVDLHSLGALEGVRELDTGRNDRPDFHVLHTLGGGLVRDGVPPSGADHGGQALTPNVGDAETVRGRVDVDDTPAGRDNRALP